MEYFCREEELGEYKGVKSCFSDSAGIYKETGKMMNDYFVIEQDFTLPEYVKVIMQSVYRHTYVRKVFIVILIAGLLDAILNNFAAPLHESGSLKISPLLLLIGVNLVFFGVLPMIFGTVIFLTKSHLINGFRFRYSNSMAKFFQDRRI
jgi:hypothetical protein